MPALDPIHERPRPLVVSVGALVLANLVPFAGVVLWGWSVSSILILYWFENVVILAGGFVATIFEEPVWVVLVLVAVKTCVDLDMHRREHRRIWGSA